MSAFFGRIFFRGIAAVARFYVSLPDMEASVHIIDSARVADTAGRHDIKTLCGLCPRYGMRWGCPPFDAAPAPWAQFDSVAIITLEVPASADLRLLRRRAEALLRRLETRCGGMMCALPGDCPYCGAQPCTRPSGYQCRHPAKVRPSLEALGVDVCALLRDCLGRSMEWHAPRLILVGAVFFNRDKADEAAVTALRRALRRLPPAD